MTPAIATDAVPLGDLTPGTEEWIDARRRRVGGSEVAAILGLSPWESYFGLWHRKRDLIGPVIETDLMWWGTQLEDDVAARFVHEHPEYQLAPIGTYVHPERDYQLISPDRRIIRRDGTGWELLELKMGHDSDEWGPAGTDEIPVQYRCQVQWAMDAFGLPTHRLAVYFGGDQYRDYLIEYDAAEAAILRRRAAAFISHVDAGEPLPDIDGHSATYQAVRELHPDIEDVDVEVPASLAEPYLAAIAAEKECEAEKRQAAALLCQHLGNARRAIYGTTPAGRPRSIACRMASSPGATPYLKASPLPKPKKEIA